MKQLYTIGHFAKLTGISADTLRYYDKIDLLKPEHTDDASSYRYYSHSQIAQLDIIKFCRSIDLPLSTIKELFKKKNPTSVRENLLEQQLILQEKIALLNESDQKINLLISRLQYFEEIQDEHTIYQKEIGPRIIARTQKPVPYTKNLFLDTTLFVHLMQDLSKAKLSSKYEGGFFYHTTQNNALETATAFEVINDEISTRHLSSEHLLGGNYLCLNYPFSKREDAIEVFLAHLNLLQIMPPFILETYLITGTFDSTDRYFELQCPLF